MSDTDVPQPDLDQQRAEIAETVDALHAKLDVPGRTKSAVKSEAARINDNPALRNGLIAAAVAGLVLVIVARVRARRRS